MTDYKFYLPEMMMLKIDRAAMANSLEVRGYIGVSIIGRTDTWTRQVLR